MMCTSMQLRKRVKQRINDEKRKRFLFLSEFPKICEQQFGAGQREEDERKERKEQKKSYVDRNAK